MSVIDADEVINNFLFEDNYRPEEEYGYIVCFNLDDAVKRASVFDKACPSQHIWTVTNFAEMELISGVHETAADEDCYAVTSLPHGGKTTILVKE